MLENLRRLDWREGEFFAGFQCLDFMRHVNCLVIISNDPLNSFHLAIRWRQFMLEFSPNAEIVLSFCRIVNLYCYICN